MTRVNRMYMLLPIVLLITVNSIVASLDVWQKECPFSNFCTTESLEKINETTDPTSKPCCGSCSCDKDCFVFENCCPDVLTSPPVDLQKANCIHLKTTNNLAGISYAEEYRVINFCPRGYDVLDKRLDDQCEERYVNDLDDVVAVSDIKNRIYKNKYCAQCQGVRDFVSWRLELITCRESFYTTSFSASQSTQAILNECELHSIPPDDDVGKYETMFCGRSLVSSCKSTTNNSVSGIDDIREKCINGPYLPFTHLWLSNKFFLFKNVFCYLCEHEEPERHMCTSPDGSVSKGPAPNFSILLNLQLGTTDQQQVKPETPFQCAESEIYDHVKGNCSRVFCPPYHVVFYGRCLGIGAFLNYGVQIRIQSKPNDSVFFSRELMFFKQEASTAYARKVLHDYGLARCDVATFVLEAFVDKETDKLAVTNTKIDIVFNDKCDATSIANIVRKRLSKRHESIVVINNISVDLSEQITFYDRSFESFPENHLYDIWTLVHWQIQGKSRATMSYDFFLCPYFIVDIQQYNSIYSEVFRKGNSRNLTEISELTRLENGFYSLTNDSIAVCVDTYFELYAKSEGLTTMIGGSLRHGIGLSLSSFLIYALIY